MARHVCAALADVRPQGRVVDLFSGMGSVAESLQDLYPVITNDVLSFTTAISRARFTSTLHETTKDDVLKRLRPVYLAQLAYLSDQFRDQLQEERAALEGDRESFATYLAHARHVGNDKLTNDAARHAWSEKSHRRYCLTCLYFSAGYFSLSQAIEIDAIRYAIDSMALAAEADWLLGSWLVGLAAVINAPGHTAQFLKPNSESSHVRILRTWRRSIWDQFDSALISLQPVGSESWRAQNEAYTADAIDLVTSESLTNVGSFYADPPYTKDQYSRYYHLYETLYRYDFPDSVGAGRVRSDRTSTSFSLKSTVVASFHDLCRTVSRRRIPLVVSYPSQGLVSTTGWTMLDIVSSHFTEVRVMSVDARHSTMGASKGSSRKHATEHLYVCLP